MTTRITLLVFTFLLTIANLTNAQAAKDPNDVRRMFLYHFIRYIEWPDDDKEGKFEIAVLNDSHMYDLLKKTMHDSKRRGKTVKITQIDENTDISNFHVVYVPSNESRHFKTLEEKSENLNLLFVTDRNGTISKGSGINFKEQGNKLRFELSIDSLEKRGLKVAGQLKQVAILI
ncbi:YfiR family protein [Chondrinema litorale]|uniref:YfiR family protein n=1 Tax=Chondrinema litorale TaxID=2994555 RepID=UPI002543F54E|nr:YfiR family protein [Chondrinema litorale]UZR93594.1 YfiR family protein [Chondrinema litorale]